MPQGSVPSNSTKAGAATFVLDNTILEWEFTQITSWWPGTGTFTPGTSVVTHFPLWFKVKPPSTFTNYYTTLGVTVWHTGSGSYHPTVDLASSVNVYDNSNNLLLTEANRGQFFTNINKNNFYYFEVITPVQNQVPETTIKIRVEAFKQKISTVESIVVQDSYLNGAIVVANKTLESTIFSSGLDVSHVFTAETGHSVWGNYGDILPSGITCIEDASIRGITIRSSNFKDTVSFSNLFESVTSPVNSILAIRRNSSGSNFWIAGFNVRQAGKEFFIRSVGVQSGGITTATLGPIISFPIYLTPVSIGIKDNDIMYYINDDETAVHRWNLVTNTPMSDLVSTVYAIIMGPGNMSYTINPNYYGTVADILVLQNGDVLVAYYDKVTAPGSGIGSIVPVMRPFTVKRYNSSGVLVKSYNFNFSSDNTGNIHHRMNYGADNNHFYVWTHFNENELEQQSGFAKVRIDDGTIVNWTFANEFTNGVLLNKSTLYKFEGIQTPIPPWGTNARHNFWINPVTIPIIPASSTTPPVTTAPGGGLIVLDPANTVKYDSYFDKVGASTTKPINVTIRTAFIGD